MMLACVIHTWAVLGGFGLGVATGAAGVVLTIRADVEREAQADRTANGVARHKAHMDALANLNEGADRGR